jgi:RNA polymerase sigma-70 factor, ECF subfamily
MSLMNDLNRIIAAHGEAVWRTAYRLLNNYDDALDCYQDTFLAAIQLSRGQSVMHWRTLLVCIATRRAMDRLRRRYQNEQAIEGITRNGAQVPSTTGPAARLETDDLREQVRRALAKLPTNQAEAFWLRHLEQWDVDEVADELGLDAGHVRVLVHRAAVALRKLLGATYGPATIQGELP